MSSGGVGQAVLSGDFFDTAEDVDETLSWEQPMERTWEEVEEDESGRLKSLRMMQQKAIKRRLVPCRFGAAISPATRSCAPFDQVGAGERKVWVGGKGNDPLLVPRH